MLEARVKHRLASGDLRVGKVADHLADHGKAAVDGLKDLQRVFLGDIEGPLDLPVCGVLDRSV